MHCSTAQHCQMLLKSLPLTCHVQPEADHYAQVCPARASFRKFMGTPVLRMRAIWLGELKPAQ